MDGILDRLVAND